MNQQTAVVPAEFIAAVTLVTNAVTSEHTKRAYTRAILDFMTWKQERPMSKALVNEYRQTLTGSPASVNLRMSAIRKLATEAADNGLLDQQTANGIKAAPGVKTHGVRVGNWLTKQEAQRLLTSPVLRDLEGIADLKAYRDRAILAVMIGAGLRRSEVASLTWDRIQQRDGRWVIVDLTGKGNRVRSVPIPSWVYVALDEWRTLAGIAGGRAFHAIHKGGHITHDAITSQAVGDVIKLYGAQIGKPELAAHDLRRTYAKLARKGGADLLQISLSLGHSSVKVTERYLGEEQNFTDAPGDRLGLSLEDE